VALRVLALLLLAFALPGCATSSPHIKSLPPIEDPSPVEAEIENIDLIDVGDEIDIKFPYRSEFNQTQPVRPDGRIALPLIEPVMAAGKTPELLREEISQLYAARSYDPVANRNQAKRRRYLLSAGDVLDIRFDYHPEYDEHVIVRPDGRISLPRVKTVLAEGKTPEELEKELMELYREELKKDYSLVVIVRLASGNLVYVDGQPTRLGVRDLEEPAVVVRRAAPQQIYVAGEVNSPGFFTYRPPMTALRAIAMAGTYKRTSKLESVIILRKTGTGEALAMKVNLCPEIKGKATTDVALKPYDIVLVPKTHIAEVQDILDQYLYNLVPASRNVVFQFFYQLNPMSSLFL